jgi:hypothetical protein
MEFVPSFHQIADKLDPWHGANPLWVIGPSILGMVQQDKAIGFVNARNLEFSAGSLVASGVLSHDVPSFWSF